MAIDLTTFFSGLGITSVNASASNQYEFYKGVGWNDSTTTNNQYEFYKKLDADEYRYGFYKQYVSEYGDFYRDGFTNDARIVDFYTFYKYAAGYFSGGAPFVNEYSMKTDGGSGNRFYIDPRDNAVQDTIRQANPRISFSFWIKTTQTAQGTIIAIWDQISPFDPCFIIAHGYNGQTGAMGIYAQNQTSGDLVNASMKSSTKVINDGIWHHIVYVYDCNGSGSGLFPATSTISQFYIDGVLYNSSSDYSYMLIEGTHKFFRNDTTIANRAPFSVGGVGVQGWFDGNVDEVSVWNRALSQTEVNEIYNSGAPDNLASLAYYSDCVAWYRMGDGSDNWDGSKWNIVNEVGTVDTDMISNGLTIAAKQADIP